MRRRSVSPVWFVQATAFLTIIVATALVLRSAGGSRALFVATLIGALHVFHAGPISAVGLVVTVAVSLGHREGFISDRQGLGVAAADLGAGGDLRSPPLEHSAYTAAIGMGDVLVDFTEA